MFWRSTLPPRPDGCFTGIDDRIGGPTLTERRTGVPRPVYSFGIDGMGGTLLVGPEPELETGRRGDCSRKVRLLMEFELLLRRRPLRLGERRVEEALRWEETDDCRWIMRFVWTFSTSVGGGVRFRRAVAAAAEERLDEEGRDLRKAWLAADWADWADDEDSGYKKR